VYLRLLGWRPQVKLFRAVAEEWRQAQSAGVGQKFRRGVHRLQVAQRLLKLAAASPNAASGEALGRGRNPLRESREALMAALPSKQVAPQRRRSSNFTRRALQI
jgi:hypothetical protein